MFGDDGCKNDEQEWTLNDEDDYENTQQPADGTNFAQILKQTQTPTSSFNLQKYQVNTETNKRIRSDIIKAKKVKVVYSS